MKRRSPAYYVNEDGTYTLDENYPGKTLVTGYNIAGDRFSLLENGNLILKPGFRWNGPSGPAVDTPKSMMPSGLHDCLYGAISAGLLPDSVRELSDETYREALRNWMVPGWRRLLHFKGVRWFGWMHI